MLRILPLLVLFFVILTFASTAFGAGYAIHGTYYDYGTVTPGVSSFPTPKAIPAVLYVSVKEKGTKIQISAPGARCIPSFGESTYAGFPSRNEPRTFVIDLRQRSECFHDAAAARLQLRFGSPREGVRNARLDDMWNEKPGVVLFQAE